MTAPSRGFGDLPDEYDSLERAGAVIIPVPYDGTSTWMKGADRGPDAIIEASAQVELYDIETGREPYRVGIYTDGPVMDSSSPEAMVRAVEERVGIHMDAGRFAVVLGGEHSVSVGSVQAHARRHGDLSVLQLDAHADLREEYHGSRYNHACVMARVRELCPAVQVGIRSMDVSEREGLGKGRTFFAHEIAGERKWIDAAVARLTGNVYITIDLDVFDPSIMPSTGTPEPGGLDWYEVLALLKRVAEKRRIVGFDVVELCPSAQNRHADFLAAKLVYKLLAYSFMGDKK
ncbi:MAG: agmatinase [Spirochaetes bacterium]|nr:agmatinase [Spirochaetota bacterium]